MALYYRKNINVENDNNNVFWTTMSDLMLGLSIIFITLFVLAMTGFTQESLQKQKLKMEIAKEIGQELKKNNIDVNIDKMTGDLKIPSTALFEVNSFILTPKGKRLLDKLAPIYINTIFSKEKLSNEIESIYIEGHTDSQSFAGLSTRDQQFIRNMDLSLKRANAVAEYILQTDYNKKNSEAFRKMMVVEGRSFNQPILTSDGKEDFEKSRRVEVKLKVKDFGIANIFGIGHKK
ncbi:OmpA family protein [bacterium]|nr:OmpA family protein [bacterium]